MWAVTHFKTRDPTWRGGGAGVGLKCLGEAQARVLAAQMFPAQRPDEATATAANIRQCFKMTLAAELNCLVS